jgi:hypothetical protein
VSSARVVDDRTPLASLSDEDLLRALGVIDESGRLLRAGEVYRSQKKQSFHL